MIIKSCVIHECTLILDNVFSADIAFLVLNIQNISVKSQNSSLKYPYSIG
ncbi:hypothetical protein [Clostridium neonatale]|nr:hypothetical protein [Clostridium neonatale]CAI3576251.1 hypothetical protein CNEO3_1520002 [Clostridium neonatale]CAI3598131.1 hypothetical protein CNEO3_1700002 [Clostridium neonatale]CAI3606004.1 hypothetical protein CNEO4_1630002 [Clostridium neonatale]CAI3623138.1 hypothetical protein CNEO4_1670003 [Clostridium neonatale]CAI4138990.1 hypothetical protein CNEO4_1600003 [Clostridium neonatale]